MDRLRLVILSLQQRDWEKLEELVDETHVAQHVSDEIYTSIDFSPAGFGDVGDVIRRLKELDVQAAQSS